MSQALKLQSPIQVQQPTIFSSHSLTKHQTHLFPRKSSLPGSLSLWFSKSRYSISPKKSLDSYEPDPVPPNPSNQTQVLKILKGVNSFIPHVVLASTVLALIFPPSFTWFTTRYYAPALGFLMFAVGVNSSEKDFIEAFNRPYNIVACAPTNVAIAELSSRVLKLVKEPYELDPGMRNSLYSLGDLLLFGNNEYLQLDGDLKEIFLDYRVDKLAEFLGRNSWKYYFMSLIDVLENCVSQYDIFIENASKSESEAVKESGSGRCSGHSFLKFIRERFTEAALPLKRCITTLGTCLTADFLLQHNYKNMSILLGLLDSFECVLSRDDVVEEELKELFAEEVLNKNASLSSRGLSGNETVKCHSLDLFYKIRCESLILLKSLSNDLNLPGHMDTDFGVCTPSYATMRGFSPITMPVKQAVYICGHVGRKMSSYTYDAVSRLPSKSHRFSVRTGE